jgi:hypothetical protein
MKAAAAQRKLALGGTTDRENDELHTLQDARTQLITMVTPVDHILAEFEFRRGDGGG